MEEEEEEEKECLLGEVSFDESKDANQGNEFATGKMVRA